jgi:hypothetical protein
MLNLMTLMLQRGNPSLLLLHYYLFLSFFSSPYSLSPCFILYFFSIFSYICIFRSCTEMNTKSYLIF